MKTLSDKTISNTHRGSQNSHVSNDGIKKKYYKQAFVYGIVGIPLAFGALPLYMHLPKVYADNTTLSLATIGVILWLSRLTDALTDPWFGQLASHSNHRLMMRYCLIFFSLLFYVLCHPISSQSTWLMGLWFFIIVTITGMAFSAANIAYQSWGAALGENKQQRSHYIISREIITLIAVIVAASLPTMISPQLIKGMHYLSTYLLVITVISIAIMVILPKQAENRIYTAKKTSLKQPISLVISQFHLLWDHRYCRWLLIIFLINGCASAIPATLFLFFVEEVLNALPWAGYFLGTYFFAAIVSMPLWNSIANRYNNVLAWQCSMFIAILSFAGAIVLTAGDGYLFFIVCFCSGVALGADLCLPSIMAANYGQENHIASIVFGWWNLLAKLSLALAAGIALPTLSLLGYQSITVNHPMTDIPIDNTLPIQLSYVVLPIIIKILALLLLNQHKKILTSNLTNIRGDS